MPSADCSAGRVETLLLPCNLSEASNRSIWRDCRFFRNFFNRICG